MKTRNLFLGIFTAFIILGSFSNTNAQVPPKPIAGFPQNGITLYLPPNPMLTWYLPAPYTGLEFTYHVQLSTDTTAGMHYVDVQNVTGYAYPITQFLDNGTNYFWRIRSKNVGGTFSAWTYWNHFVTAGNPLGNIMVNAGYVNTTGLIVSLPVSIDLNGRSGSKAYVGNIYYDDTKLELTNIDAGIGTLFNEYNFVLNYVEDTPGFVKFAAYSLDELGESGVIFNMNFNIVGNSGYTEVEPDSFYAYTPDFGIDKFTYNFGQVHFTFTGPPISSRGDANLDGLINMNDAITIGNEVALQGGLSTVSDPGIIITNSVARANAAEASGTGDLDIDGDDVDAVIFYVLNNQTWPTPRPAGSATLGSTGVSYGSNGRIQLPLRLTNVNNVASAEIIFSYEHEKINYSSFASQLLASGYFVNAAELAPGVAKFVLATGSLVSGTLDLGKLNLTFNNGVSGSAVLNTQIKINGSTYQAGPSFNFTPTNLETVETLPTEFAVKQNYPNPFNPSTTIEFSIPNNSNVKVSIYNLIGQEIRTLVNSEMEAGTYKVTWNGENNLGQKVNSGIYLYRVVSGDKVQTMKMTLMK